MKKTLHATITDFIINYIKENKLQSGDKLPPYRKLASLFGASSHTVGVAIEKLSYRGIVEVRPQSGAYVAKSAWESIFPKQFNWHDYTGNTAGYYENLFDRFAAAMPQHELSYAYLSPEFGWLPIFEKAVRSALHNIKPDEYNNISGFGSLRLREELSKHFQYTGLDITAKNIILTRGLYNTLFMIAHSFFDQDSVCYYASPGMPDHFEMYERIGIKKVPVVMDAEGLSLEDLSQKINRRQKAFLITEPVIHTPSGITMSMPRRKDLYNFCSANSIPIIEIDEHRDLHPNPLPPVKALDSRQIVFYTGTFAKTVSRSLSAAWVAAPLHLIGRMSNTNLSMGQSYDNFTQMILYELLAGGGYRDYIIGLRDMLEQRRRDMNAILDRYFSDIADWDRKSGIFWWLYFRSHIDVHKMEDNHRIAFADYRSFALSKPNSMFVCPVKFTLRRLEEVMRELSFIARKSLK